MKSNANERNSYFKYNHFVKKNLCSCEITEVCSRSINPEASVSILYKILIASWIKTILSILEHLPNLQKLHISSTTVRKYLQCMLDIEPNYSLNHIQVISPVTNKHLSDEPNRLSLCPSLNLLQVSLLHLLIVNSKF